MSFKTKIATLAIAALAVTGSIAASTQSAHAGHKGKALAAGLFGAAIVGTTIVAASQPGYGYYPHRRHCFLQPQYNIFHQFVGYQKVCRWR